MPAVAPLTGRPPLAAAAIRIATRIRLRHAEPCCDPGPAVPTRPSHGPTRARPLVVQSEPRSRPPSIRDETLLVEEWRLRADGTAGSRRGAGPKANRGFLYSLTANPRWMSRPGPMSACGLSLHQRQPAHRHRPAAGRSVEVRVMAIDSQPSSRSTAQHTAARWCWRRGSPGRCLRRSRGLSAARTSRPLLHEGKGSPRTIGCHRRLARCAAPSPAPLPPPPPPLPSNGLPARLDLKSALRVDCSRSSRTGLVVPALPPASSAHASPAFPRQGPDASVVLALTNRAAVATASSTCHGHHFRLLDRLDDGWKPFWLDHAGDRARADPADRVRRRISPGAG